MNAPFIRTAVKEQSVCRQYVLESQETQESLDLLLEIVNTCRGPNGRTKMIQNSLGGHVTLTSSSKRLFGAMSISKPIIRLIVSAAQGHLNACSDGGLFVVSFCSLLVKLSLNLNVGRLILTDLYEELLKICMKYINNPIGVCKTSGKISDLGFISTFVDCILVSKPLCRLHKSLLRNLLLEAFLFSIPDDFKGAPFLKTLHIVSLDERDPKESALFKGLLLRAPEIPSFEELDLNVKTDNGIFIKTIIVTSSMSGDLAGMVDAKLEVNPDVDVEEEILKFLENFCDYVISENVGVVLCQKVIHPRLKHKLRGAGILAVDRLGLQLAKLAVNIAGAVPVQTFVTPMQTECFGSLTSLCHKILNEKSYLLLARSDKTVCTLLLCGQQEESVEELKQVCLTVLSLLEQLLHQPHVLAGAGCWQTHLAAALRKQVFTSKESLTNDFNCSLSALTSACQTFAHCLELAGMTISHDEEDHLTDHTYHHLWRVPKGMAEALLQEKRVPEAKTCSCGLIEWEPELKYQQLIGSAPLDTVVSDGTSVDDVHRQHATLIWNSTVMDLESTCANALKTAVLTACTVLQTRQYVEDGN